MKRTMMIAGAFALSGCVSFRGGLDDLPKTVKTTAAAAGDPVPLTYSMKWSTRGNPNGFVQEQMRPHVESELRDAGLFGNVTQGTGTPYHLDVEIANDGNVGVALLTGALSGLTLTILPGYAHDDYTMTATLTKNGQKVKSYTYEAGVTTWIEFFLLFGMPFKESDVVEKTVENMTRHLVADMAADNVISGQ